MLAPICLFTYNRLNETQRTIETLKSNSLAFESELFIFSDGPKDQVAVDKVNKIRQYLKTVEGFKSINIFESNENNGLANSIISGVTKIIRQYGKVIVVEDDLILSKNFLQFMNLSLDKYYLEQQIFSISGFCLKIRPPKNYPFDVFFWGRAHSWGWATWINRWESIDWEIKDWSKFEADKIAINQFNQYGTDLFRMLKKSMDGKVDSWFIRFTYNQYKQQRFTVYPLLSKVINNGFIEEATHTNVYNRNIVFFDQTNSNKFNFSDEILIDEHFRKQLVFYKSYYYRMIGKILTQIMKLGLIRQQIQKTNK